jgi:steroid delta-isomerase-like uncharacterized protein
MDMQTPAHGHVEAPAIANQEVARRIVEEIWNGRNLAAVDALVSTSHIHHDPATPYQGNGPEGFKRSLMMYVSAFPDIHFTIQRMMEDADTVVTWWSCTATHQGLLNGIAPTGNPISVSGVSVRRMAGGKVEETWEIWDAAALMEQLGVLGDGTRPLASGQASV